MHCHRLLLPLAISLVSGLSSAMAETTPPQVAAPQPSLPQNMPEAPIKPGSPVVDQMIQAEPPVLVVHKQAKRSVPSRHHIAHRSHVPRDLDRPALAGVELVTPLPPPDEPPHINVPMPAFPFESVAAAFLTPPPPIICHPVARERGAPDPHLYREIPVACEADNP